MYEVIYKIFQVTKIKELIKSSSDYHVRIYIIARIEFERIFYPSAT